MSESYIKRGYHLSVYTRRLSVNDDTTARRTQAVSAKRGLISVRKADSLPRKPHKSHLVGDWSKQSHLVNDRCVNNRVVNDSGCKRGNGKNYDALAVKFNQDGYNCFYPSLPFILPTKKTHQNKCQSVDKQATTN